MFTSNSYLAPETGKRRRKDALAEIWRAESYMDERKITEDRKRINWFVRGSPNCVVTWFINNKGKIETWNDLKIEYISIFGNDANKDQFLLDTYQQTSESVGEFTRKLLNVVVSKENKGHKRYTML